MSSVPGKVGWPVVGDISYSFYKDPTGFIERNVSINKSRIFKARFLTKPTVFVGTNKGVQDVLNDETEALDLGYKSFMHQVYGDNVLFLTDEESIESRQSLGQLFTSQSIQNYQETVCLITAKHLQQVDTSKPLCVYNVVKRLATEICLSLFLDLDFEHSSELAEKVTSLTKAHWHGIISVPLPLKLPTGGASTFTKAIEAKTALLQIIQEKLEQKSGFPHSMESLPLSDNHVQNHLLLFTSALVPKAIASLLTSFITATGQPDQALCQDELLSDPDLMESVLLEVQRLYPPFIGGRRLVRKNCTVDGYSVTEGQAIMYLTHSAHRDPTVFSEPDKFSPERWKNGNSKDKDKLFCFGSGRRGCIGQKFVLKVIHKILEQFLEQFRWKVLENQDLTPKWLPVSRPRESVMVQLSRKNS